MNMQIICVYFFSRFFYLLKISCKCICVSIHANALLYRAKKWICFHSVPFIIFFLWKRSDHRIEYYQRDALLLFDNCIANKKNGYARATFTMEPKAFMCFHFVRGLFDAIRINPSYCHFHILPHKVARVISVLFLCVRKRTFFIHADARKTVEDTILLLLKCR